MATLKQYYISIPAWWYTHTADRCYSLVHAYHTIRRINISHSAVWAKIYMPNIFVIQRNGNLVKYFSGETNPLYGM